MKFSKKVFVFCFCLIGFSLNTFCQQAPTSKKITQSSLPKPVWQSYLSQNSGGQLDTVWEQVFVPVYKVNYTSGNKKLTASYTEEGNWINTLEKIELTDLPVSVINQIKTRFPGFEIKTCHIELSNSGKLYAVGLLKGDKVVTDYYQMDGRATSK